jgi:CubicO group peptidase (beta-lactamase class C family)
MTWHVPTRTLTCIVIGLALALSDPAKTEPWPTVDLAASGWSAEKLHAAEQDAARLHATGIAVVHEGKLLAQWGDVQRKVNVASVRKSLLSALYGIAVADGKISLDASLSNLDIDDKSPGLTLAERRATVRDLLKARSGIYHPAAYETPDISTKRPARGSHPPGSTWFYNNWDFNTLGTIYRKATGEDIFESFDGRIARPIGMEDFSARDGRYVTEAASVHSAYPFMMTARDLARFGQLFLNNGIWKAQQIIPASWVRESTTSYSDTDRAGRGYGYMWWTLRDPEFGSGAYLASGFGGQFLAVIPAKRLVVAQTVDHRQNAAGVRARDFLAIVKQLIAPAS